MLYFSQRNDLTTPLSDFVLTSSFTKPNPERDQFKHVRNALQYQLDLSVQTYNHSGKIVGNHTIAFVEDVLGRLAQITI